MPGRGSLAAEEVLDRFRRRGALLEGHFLLSSGLHSSVYFQSALLLQHPADAEALGCALAERVREQLQASPGAESAQLVIAPALGGIVIGHELARALGIRSLFAERQAGRMALRRGFRIEPGERAVVCEDVVTTGGSAREVADLVRREGGDVAVTAALVDRGTTLRSGMPVAALARLAAPTHEPAECPLCAAAVPLVKPGSRQDPPRQGEQ
ncbi:MAG: orotate phosphoribosyltransferase [Gemmatimonadetes bacterium]|nr:orotate phosphoribosyltransferase [Gemmatimonadota bacterium]